MLIGIDQGTTGTTCAAFDDRLGVVATAYRPLLSYFPRPGWVEQDPDDIVASVADSVSEVLAKIGGAKVVEAVGVANQGETVVAWDEVTGRSLSPAIVWSDTRSSVVVERLAAAGHGERIAAATGLRLGSYYCAAKYAWLLEHVAAVQDARSSGTLRLGTLDAWLGRRLCEGHRTTDEGTASRTQLLALGAADWSAELLDIFGVPAEMLPRLQPTLADHGSLGHPTWQGGLPWRASLIDQAAALAGHGCFDVGEMKVTYGTGSFLLVNVGRSHRPPPDGISTMLAWSDAKARTYAFDGGAFTAGTAIAWLKSVGIIGSAEECSGLAEAVGGTAGVRFLPALTGLGSPWLDDGSSGSFSGLTAGTERGHLVRAVLDAIAFRVRDIVEALSAAGIARPNSLRVDGGLTRNRYLMQRQADVLGIPLEQSSNPEATALGAAALAGMAAGIVDVWSTRTLPRGLIIEPRLGDADRETEYGAWRDWLASARAGRGG